MDVYPWLLRACELIHLLHTHPPTNLLHSARAVHLARTFVEIGGDDGLHAVQKRRFEQRVPQRRMLGQQLLHGKQWRGADTLRACGCVCMCAHVCVCVCRGKCSHGKPHARERKIITKRTPASQPRAHTHVSLHS